MIIPMPFMFLTPLPPFIKMIAAYISAATPKSDKIIPNTRFSILLFLQDSLIKQQGDVNKIMF